MIRLLTYFLFLLTAASAAAVDVPWPDRELWPQSPQARQIAQVVLFSRGGSAYYYLTDYQGNNIAVVDAGGGITQRTDYYPYGEPWRYPDGQQYLYSDKELTRADGRHAYTFPARTLLPNFPRWSTPDPHSESYYSVSPYSYCAANPIMAIDPNGSDTFLLSPMGELIARIYDDNNDSFCILDITADVMPSFALPYGTITSYFTESNEEGAPVAAYTMNIFGEAMELFIFFSEKTKVEWSLYDNSNSNYPKAFISTSFQEGYDLSAPHLIHKYNLNPTMHYHNHHNSSKPSKADESNDKGDIDFAKSLSRKNQSLSFYIFYKGEIFPYSAEPDEKKEDNDGFSGILENVNCIQQK